MQESGIIGSLCISLMMASVPIAAQQFRGSITGRVLDSQGAVIPDVRITAIQVDTQSRAETISSEFGQYTLPFLQPGVYRVEAVVPGFKRYVRQPVQVSSNQQLELEIQLEVGEVAESVTISAEAPMLTTTSASTGQVISSRFIEAYPLNGRSPLSFAQIAYGVVPTSDPLFQRPFDNSRISSFSMGGAPSGSNELLLDGAPDTIRGGNVAYSPPVDTVDEVKIETFQVDAAYGNTGGGTVNIVSKGGTNRFHGTAYDFNQVSLTAATDFFVNRAGQTKTNLVYNQFGVTGGGPLYVPKLIDGRNRVFWFFAYEGIKHVNPEPVTVTVPTAAMRNGDFSSLLSLGAVYQIYDPLTGVREGARVRRQPLSGNTIPRNRLNPIALNYLPYYPLPNQAGRPDGRDNFLAASTRREDFNSETGRIDFNLSEKHKFFFNMRHNERLQDRGNYFKNVATGNFLRRINWGATFDDVYTFNPTTVLNSRLNWTRFTGGNVRPSLGFDMTSLGFPASLRQFSSQAVMPQIGLSNFQNLGTTGSIPVPFEQFQIFLSLMKTAGSHNWKAGADLRLYRDHGANFGASSGLYDFSTNWTRGPLDNSPASPLGQDLASFLLGMPTGGRYDAASFRSNQSGYWALFLHDDWKVTPAVTLNLGLRYEKEVPTTERFDRQVVGFDAAASNAVTGPAKAAYARNAQPELPAAQFNPAGGVLFARQGKRTGTSTSSRLFSPRAGIAWAPAGRNKQTVLRGGLGIFYFTEGIIPSQQPGFFQSTPLVSTLDGFLTPTATLSNPFPDGVRQPVGNALGLNTFLGQSVNFYNPSLGGSYSLRWSFTVQQALNPNLMLEVGYLGNRAIRLTLDRGLNWVPGQFLSTSAARDQRVIDRLTANVANPFQGLLPGTNLNGSTVQLQQLLRAYPQFIGDNGVSMSSDNFGSSYFHSLQARLERRLAGGFSYLVNYQFSRLLERRSFLNPFDSAPEKRIANEDRPQRLVASGMFELPFGRGKALASDAGAVLNRVIGGWSVSGSYTYALEAPLTWGNVIYNGGPLNYDGRNIDRAFDISRFNTVPAQQLLWNVRGFPSRFSPYRRDATNNFDISILKDTVLRESVKLQFRAEFFNALNHVNFDMPQANPTNSNFGRITRQYNLPRTTQLALRLLW